MPTLLQISADLTALNVMIEESTGEDGELKPEVAAAVDVLLAEIEKGQAGKADNYGALMREWELEACAHQAEIDRHQAAKKALDSRRLFLKDRLKTYMELHEIKEIKTPRFAFRLQTSGGKQALDLFVPADQLPKQYQRIKVEADNDALRQGLEAKDTAAEAVAALVPRGKHLIIK